MLCGFLFGTACLIGLAKVLHCGGRWHGRGGCHGGGWRDWHDRHGWRGRGPGFGKKAALRWLFERLDTTPGQEKVIFEALDELKEPFEKARSEWRGSVGEFGKAVRGAELDHTAMAEAWTKHDRGLEALRVAIVAQLARVHEALDEKQRRILADMIESSASWCGPAGCGVEI